MLMGDCCAAGHWNLTQSDFPAFDFCVFLVSTQENEETHDFNSEWVTRAVTWSLSELGDKGVFPTFQIPVQISILTVYGRARLELQFRTIVAGLK